MQPKILAVSILVLSTVIGFSVLENSASAAKVITWTNTTFNYRPFCNFNTSGTIPTTETSRTRVATGQAYNAIMPFDFKIWLFNCFFFTDEEYYIFETCMDGTWLVWCGGLAGGGTWSVIVYLPTVSVSGAPGAWQSSDAYASVSCSQPLGSCDGGSYRLLVYYSDPGAGALCPTNYDEYTIAVPAATAYTISSHAWACAAANDTAGDTGFSVIPIEFKVDKILPAGSILIENGIEYTTSQSVTLNLAYSDTGGSGIQDCRYSNDGSTWSAWEPCPATYTKSWTLTAGVELKTVYFQVRDGAGNIFQSSDTITLLSESDCEGSAGLYCCVRNGACNPGEVDVLHMSDRINAHAELRNQSNYNWKMCCGGVTGLGAGCSGIYDTVIKLFSQTNSHVEKSTLSNYNYLACLNITAGTVDCDYPSPGDDCTALGPDYICVAKLSADTNAHISDCDDPNYNRRACCRAANPPCTLTSVTMTANCAGGASPYCEAGETIRMSGRYTGDCSKVNFFQVDASGTGCTIRFSGGDISGIWNGSGLINSGGYINGTWNIPTIPLTCSGRTVSASMGYLYDSGPPPLNLITSAAASGSFTFKDMIPPTTTINPNGRPWINSDIPFTLTCTDDPGGLGCKTTYYKIIDASQTCTAGGFSASVPPLSVTCPPNSICERRVCYYSDDNAGNMEAIKTSNVFQIDRTIPLNVDVTHTPPNPTDLNLVNFTATASDTGSPLEIFIYVEDVVGSGSYNLIGSCFESPCLIPYRGPYSPGIHNYYAVATDEATNSGSSAAKQFTVTGCTLHNATISLIDANLNGLADTGEIIRMSGNKTGNCTMAKFFQIDARSADDNCIIEFSPPPGNISGITNSTGLNISGNYVNGTWSIPAIGASCSGKTVFASAAALYDPGPPPIGLIPNTLILAPGKVTGSFTFNDVLAPITTINPNGASWTNINVSFTLSCTDTGGGTCDKTYYKIMDDGSICNPNDKTGFSLATPSLSVNCSQTQVCQKRVCFYSNDNAGNIELTQTSNLFQIDRENPAAWITQPSGAWTNLNSIPVSWSGSDSGSGIASYNIQHRVVNISSGIEIIAWSDWLYQTTVVPPQNYVPAQAEANNHSYYFRANATDNVGNTGLYSAERSISVDTELPNLSYTIDDDTTNSMLSIVSTAWDNVSGLYNHTISCIGINPTSSLFVQCPAPSGGISTCPTPQMPYIEETEISCELRAQDVAGNVYYTSVFYTSSPDNLLMKLYEQNVFISIGETYHARIQLRNIKSTQDMINVSLHGTYSAGFATFLESSPITWISVDKRNITALLNAYEQKTIYVEIISTDQGEYTLELRAGSQNYPINSTDTMNIQVGFPAAFPAVETLSIAALLLISCLAYFIYIRKLK